MSGLAFRSRRIRADQSFRVVPLRVKYPQGDSKMMIKTILGLEVPAGLHAADLGIIMNNVSTIASIADFFDTGMPYIDRMLTVTGPGIRIVDFNIDNFRSSYDRRRISDARLLAHYYNNVAVERMQAGDAAAALGDGAQLVVAQIARVVVDVPTRGMAGHERPGGHLREVVEARVREVADVDDHAQLLHAPDRA